MNLAKEIVRLLTDLLNEIKMLGTSQKLAYTTSEVAYLIGTYPEKVDAWRRLGLLKAIKKGRGYIYTKKEIERFLDRWEGKELPNISEMERKGTG